MFETKTGGYMAALVVAALALIPAAHAQRMALCLTGTCGLGIPSHPIEQYVSPPDMALQFSTCLSSPLPAFVSGVLHDKLASAMHDLDVNHDDPPPDPDVRHACINGRSTFGGWLAPTSGYGSWDTDAARDAGLGTVDVLAGAEQFSFNFRPIGLSRLVQIRWQDQPRVLNDDGEEDPDGRVHLTDYDLYFKPWDVIGDPSTGAIVQGPSVDLAINGWYDYIQNTNFTLDVFDFPSHTPFGGLQCQTFSGAHPTETTIDTILASLTGGASGTLGNIVGEGPACKIAHLLPPTVLLPQTQLKVEFHYSRVSSDSGSGVTFAGQWEVLARQPSMIIQGPALLKGELGDPFSGTYSVTTSDLRPPFSVSWTSIDALPVSGQNNISATMTWNVAGLGVGQTANRNVTVRLTDADGLTALRVKPVTLSRVLDSDTDANPTCRNKPWLPQCQL